MRRKFNHKGRRTFRWKQQAIRHKARAARANFRNKRY